MRRVLFAIIGFFVLVGLGVGGYFIYRAVTKKSTITVWTMQGTEDAIKQVADIYTQKHRGQKVTIVAVPAQIYEFNALYALASQKGSKQFPVPDVWIMPNDWIALHQSKLVAAPKGALSDAFGAYETKRDKGVASPSPAKSGRDNATIIKEDFPPVVANDVVRNNDVYGVPLALDTLALIYDKTKIATPPKTWQDMVTTTKQLTARNGDTVTRSVVAMGDPAVAYFPDILSTLMLQNGAQMVDEASQTATFNIAKTGATAPGTNALSYYTSFAQPGKETYTWQKSMGDSIDALKSGKTLQAFGYMTDAQVLGVNASSKYAVAPLPQLNSNQPITYGRYLAATVTKQASEPDKAKAAWQFVSLWANSDVSERYAASAGLVPARTNVADFVTPPAGMQSFYAQAKHATNWQKAEVSVADGALTEAVDLVVKTNERPQIALDVAAKAYTSFLQRETGIETDPNVMSMWQWADDPTDYKEATRAAMRDNKDIKQINVTKHDAERFEWEMLNAMAARQGPDIALLPNDTLTRYAPLLRSLPKGSLNPSSRRMSDQSYFEKNYAPAIVTDSVIDGKVYGFPAQFETLMLAMNSDTLRDLNREKRDDATYEKYRDLFRSGPVLWSDLKTMAEIATKKSGTTLDRAFLALGTASNVDHAEDVFAVLVKQFGGELSDPDRNVTGIHLPFSSRDKTIAGKQALDLMKTYATSGSSNYTWNATMPNSLEALATGKTMAAFMYPRDIAKVHDQSPNLELRYFPLPQQAENSEVVDFASYYMLTLPIGGKRPTDGMNVIRAAVTGDIEGLNGAKRSSRDVGVTDRARKDPQRLQVNTAQSYYKGRYPDEVDDALKKMLDGAFTLDQAANAINQSLRKTIL